MTNKMYRRIGLPLMLSGFIASFACGTFGVYHELKSGRLVREACEKLPKEDRVFKHHVIYELPKNKREEIERSARYSFYGNVGLVAFYGLMFTGAALWVREGNQLKQTQH
jgi:hypothetical protein